MRTGDIPKFCPVRFVGFSDLLYKIVTFKIGGQNGNIFMIEVIYI